MFWRFGFHSSSAIDAILEREGTGLDDLMAQDELLQEVKAQSTKLIDFLCKPQNLEKLVGYIIADDLEEAKRFKYPFVASEIFGMEVFAICEALLQNKPLLTQLWGLLEKNPPLNPLQASYFTKVNCVLLNKKTAAMIAFLRAQPTTIKLLLKHLGCSAIADLVLKLISVEDMPEGSGIIKWLSSEGLIPHLFSQLNPDLDPETHTTAAQTLMDIISVSYQSLVPPEQTNALGQPVELPPSVISGAGNMLIDKMKNEVLLGQLFDYMIDRRAPNATSSLTNGVSIIMELIRKYCSEIEHAEMQQHHHQVQLQANNVVPIAPSPEKLNMLAVDMNDLLRIFVSRLPALSSFLTSPRNAANPIDTTIGRQIPLGSERLKICELFAEVLHLQYLFTSSPLFDLLVKPPPFTSVMSPSGYPQSQYQLEYQQLDQHPTYVAPSKTVIDGLVSVTDCFVQEKILVNCIQLFFAFKWNNFLHSVVFDMIAKVLNTYSYTSAVPTPLAMTGPMPSIAELPTSTDASDAAYSGQGGSNVSNSNGPSSASAHQKMKEIRRTVKKLVVSIFKDAQLMTRIIDAQLQNDYDVEKPRGVRHGYMGHLTYISDEVCKLFEKCGPELDDQLHECITSEAWQEYVTHTLKETRERDRTQLGGERPQMPANQGMAFGGPGVIPGGKFDDASEFGKSRKKTDATRDASDDDEAITGKGGILESETFNDQFARYLCNQLVKDLPDRLLGGDSSDEDEEVDKQWMGEIEGKVGEFNIAEAIQLDDTFQTGSRINEPDDETGSEDMSSSKIEGDDDSYQDSRSTGGFEGSKDTSDFVPNFGAAFSTKELERALDAAVAAAATVDDADADTSGQADSSELISTSESVGNDGDVENDSDEDDVDEGTNESGGFDDAVRSAHDRPASDAHSTASSTTGSSNTAAATASVASVDASTNKEDAADAGSISTTLNASDAAKTDAIDAASQSAGWADFSQLNATQPPDASTQSNAPAASDGM